MAWSTPRTWVTGEVVTAAQLNAELRDNLSFLYTPPMVRAFHSVAQATISGTALTLTFNSERFDTDTMHDTVTNPSRFTCKTAGKYLATAAVQWGGNGAGTRQTQFKKSNVTFVGSMNTKADPYSSDQALASVVPLVVNDYIEVVVFQDSGAGVNVNSTAQTSPEASLIFLGN